MPPVSAAAADQRDLRGDDPRRRAGGAAARRAGGGPRGDRSGEPDLGPYVWGGGHLSWKSRGYDCSGAVGYALHGAGMLDYTMVSGQLAHWGEGGVGRWITVYANAKHVYMVVAGLRFDTRDGLTARTGPRWHTEHAARPDPPLHRPPPRGSVGRSAADVEADQLGHAGDGGGDPARARGRRAGPPPWP